MSIASLRNPARPGKPSRTLDDILIAVQRLLMEHPASTLSISQVAAEAGIVQGSFYNYFDSVTALVDEVGHLLLTRTAELLQMLGLSRARAKRIAYAEMSCCAPMDLPLSWQTPSPLVPETEARKR